MRPWRQNTNKAMLAQMNSTEFSFCANCGGSLPKAANFCPSCGKKLNLIKLGFKSYAIVSSVGLVIFAIAWASQQYLAGTKPTQAFKQGAKIDNNPLIENLRAAAKSSPDSKEAWVALAQELISELQDTQTPPTQLIFETMEALREVLRLDAKDSFALVAMADISFEAQVFDKAADFYKQYLAINPNNGMIRARYANALSFAGKTKEARLELDRAMKDDPNNFQTLAYAAVAYAQLGEVKKALEISEMSQNLAPTSEAKARLSQFVEELKQRNAKPEISTARDNRYTNLVDHIKSNPVAGPKFKSAEPQSNQILVLNFENFPMDQMPPFVRDKFVNSIKSEAIQIADLKTLIFRDSATNKDLLSIEIRK